MILFAQGSAKKEITEKEIKNGLYDALEKLGDKNKVLAIPPDFTRLHSKAGELTQYTYEYYKERLTDILPALGTHKAMTEKEISTMFGNIPKNLFKIHNWKKDLVTLGEVPSEFIREISEGKVDYKWPAQVNKLLVDGKHDLILSIGQVVPHEVVGMANYNKNVLIGTGGKEGINKSHFLGAVCGIEKIMGRLDTPVRKILNYASDNFAGHLPIVYVLTVIAKNEKGNLVVRGLFIGDDYETFRQAAELSLKVNFNILDDPLNKVVVYLNPQEYKSTWLGNKSVYRTRMAIKDGGELIVLAPGVNKFGEDSEIDAVIRKYGYTSSSEILNYVKTEKELQNNLSAAAHLIHGSSEGRFKITYSPGGLAQEEIEGVNFNYSDPEKMLKKYNPDNMKEGFNILPGGEEIFYISNPALGLWAYSEKFLN